MGGIQFEILVDEALSKVTSVPELQQALNKRLVSSINGFEDGRWRYPTFQSYLWDNIAQTALSQREREALVDGSHSTLVACAQNLRLTDQDEIGEGSEIAEVFLYAFMKHHFQALPVVPKIFYKQNTQDNAKGADSVHIVVDGEDFSLWFGEAKFYNSIEDVRLNSVVKSVLTSLKTDKLKKENSIITNVSDLDRLAMPQLIRERIKKALEPRESMDDLKPKLNIPIMLLHQCGITSGHSELSDSYRDQIRSFHQNRAESYFSKQMAKSSQVFKYEQVRFHLILFPVPDRKKIIDAFVNAVKFYKGQAHGPV